MSAEIFVVPRLMASFPRMPGLLQAACLHADSRNSGLPVSQFLSEISDAELYELVQLTEQAKHEQDQGDHGLVLAIGMFCAMMAISEGLVVMEDDDLTIYVSRLGLLAQAEGLSREGLLAFDASTMTLDEFDVNSIPRTKLGEQTISEIVIQKMPRA